MPHLRTYRVFISHAWKYDSEYDRLVQMLNEAPNFRWVNYSVPYHDPLDAKTDKELENELRDQIRPVNIVIILAGMYVAHSKWIQKEIDLAESYSKPIIGIRPWGQQRVPRAVQDAAIEMVGWNTNTIVGAIRRHSL